MSLTMSGVYELARRSAPTAAGRRGRLAGALFVACVAVAGSAAAACPGDCDGSADVTVDEIVTLINIALGNRTVDECAAGDGDADGRVTVDEIIRSVVASLDGCPPAVATPTPAATATATATATPSLPDPILRSFDFRNGASGWTAGFADYPADQTAEFDLVAELATLPEEVGIVGTGLRLAGDNHSDDLFMFLARSFGPADGIEPGIAYEAFLRIRFASNAPSGCPGIGGAPGESVFLKAGVADTEPETFVDDSGDVRMTVDKGNQAEGGPAASVVGNIANGLPCSEVDPGDPPYRSLVRDHMHTDTVRANDSGEIWVLVGTDSGFEGRTDIYYERIAISLNPVGTQ